MQVDDVEERLVLLELLLAERKKSQAAEKRWRSWKRFYGQERGMDIQAQGYT